MIRFQDISFIIQGPVDKSVTPECTRAIRKDFPGSEIVLSTWDGADASGVDYDVALFSPDPGAHSFTKPGDSRVLYNNGNRQLVSTKAGLKKASGRYAAKLRSDLLLHGASWLEYWDRFPQRTNDWRMFRERIITGNLYARNPLRDIPKPFHPSDWFMFGLREDLLLLWDVDLEPEPEHSTWFGTHPYPPLLSDCGDLRRYQAEQYLWKTLLDKFGAVTFDHLADASPTNILLTQLTFANNLIILDPAQLPLTVPKHGRPRRMWRYACYNHNEWKRLYRQYCCGQLLGATASRLLDARHWAEGIYCRMPAPLRDGAWKVSAAGRQLAKRFAPINPA